MRSRVWCQTGRSCSHSGTNVYTHARQPAKGEPPSTTSDPEAGWSVKGGSKTSPKKRDDVHFGYTYNLMADATYGLPMMGFTTPGNHAEQPEFRRLLRNASVGGIGIPFSPNYVTADKGYDSTSNYELVESLGAVPIIARRNTGSKRKNGKMRAADGSPTCMGGEYVSTRAIVGGWAHEFKCPDGGRHLKGRTGVLYCQDTLTENVYRPRDPDAARPPRSAVRRPSARNVSFVPRQSPLWKKMYDTRQSVERLFKSMKQSKRLN